MKVTGEKLLGFRARAVLALCLAAVLCVALVQPAFAQGTGMDQYTADDGCTPASFLTGNLELNGVFQPTSEQLRVVYQTQEADGSLRILVKDANGEIIIDETIDGIEGDVIEATVVPGDQYTITVTPTDQFYQVTAETIPGPLACTAPDQQNDPTPGDPTDNPTPTTDPADTTTTDPGDTTDLADVVDGTTPDKPLPDTGGLPLAGLVVIGLALVGIGGSIVRAGVERRS